MIQSLPKVLVKHIQAHFREQWRSKIYFYLLAGYTSSLFLPFIFTNIFTLLLIIISIFNRQIKQQNNKKYWLLLSVLIYLSYFIGITYTDNIPEGLASLEQKLSLIIFPLIFYFNANLKLEEVEGILNIFVCSAILAALTCCAYILLFDLYGNEPASIDWTKLTYHNLSASINFHAVYLGMYICFAAIILMFRWPKSKGAKRVLISALILFLTIFLVLLSARIVLAAYILISLVLTLIYAYRTKALLRLMLYYGIALAFTAVMIYKIPPLQERVKEAVNYKSQYSIDKQWGGRAMRFLKWQCCIEIIRDYPVIGVGTGSEQDNLQQCYKAKDLTPLLYWSDIKFNAHNQYFQTAIAIGILGLLILLTNLGFAVKLAIQRRQYAYLSFAVLVIICFLTESMLQTNKGVVFYSFFNSLFLFSEKKR